jgi:hypothetical protein
MASDSNTGPTDGVEREPTPGQIFLDELRDAWQAGENVRNLRFQAVALEIDFLASVTEAELKEFAQMQAGEEPKGVSADRGARWAFTKALARQAETEAGEKHAAVVDKYIDKTIKVKGKADNKPIITFRNSPDEGFPHKGPIEGKIEVLIWDHPVREMWRLKLVSPTGNYHYDIEPFDSGNWESLIEVEIIDEPPSLAPESPTPPDGRPYPPLRIV